MPDPYRPARPAAPAGASTPGSRGPVAGVAAPAAPLRYRPIWNVRQKAIGLYLCEADGGGFDAASTAESTGCGLLRRMLADIDRTTRREGAGAVCIPAHPAILSDAASRGAFVAACETIAPALRGTLLWEISCAPGDISERMLFSMVSTLKPYGRAIFLRSRLAETDFGIPAAVGVHSIGIDLGAIAEPEAEIAVRLEKFADNAHRSGLRCHVHGLPTSSLSLAAVSSGFDYLAGDAIAACADAPWGVQPFDAESLFLRRLATADA